VPKNSKHYFQFLNTKTLINCKCLKHSAVKGFTLFVLLVTEKLFAYSGIAINKIFIK